MRNSPWRVVMMVFVVALLWQIEREMARLSSDRD